MPWRAEKRSPGVPHFRLHFLPTRAMMNIPVTPSRFLGYASPFPTRELCHEIHG
jgi:hypothetical protein